MLWKQEKIEDVLNNYLIINSNADTPYNCYYKCANKKRVEELFSQKNHQIIFGRRGTGKTTLFKALYYYTNYGLSFNSSIKCVYIDMEDVVPDNNEIRTDDQKVIIIETYRKFLVEFLDQLMKFWEDVRSTNHFFDIYYSPEDINLLSKKLEVLLDLIIFGKKSTTSSTGVEKASHSVEKSDEASLTANIEFNSTPRLVSALSKISFGKNSKKKNIKEVSIQNEFIYTLDIYSIKKALDDLIEAFKFDRLIVCIDEFTRVDKGLGDTIQPYIAQLIKDTFFRNPYISVKVSSLWNETQIQKRQLNGERIGIELGEDIKRGVDLDTMFFGNETSCSFFKNMIMNTCLLCQDKDSSIGETAISQFREYLIDSLFTDEESFKLMVCGSQGVPRIFGNLLLAAISKRIECERPKIDAQIVYECIIENSTRDVRRKLPYSDEIVCLFDDFVTEKKNRFILVSVADYNRHRNEIDGLLNNNYMHQYPSEKVHRNLRNRYKVYLIHLGNYLEAIGIKDWRKNLSSYTILYPQPPEDIISSPWEYQIALP